MQRNRNLRESSRERIDASADRYVPKSAFTLLEVLVVIAIIAVLASLIGVAVISGVNTARVSATKGTLVKIQGLLQARIDALRMKDLDQTFVRDVLVPKLKNQKRAEAIAQKIRFRQAFPQTWLEIETFYPTLLNGHTYPLLASRNPATESAEVLLFILTKANVLGYAPEGADTFSTSEMKDTDLPPNGAMEFIDAWEKPLRFYRWPTRLVRGGPYTAGGFTLTPAARALMSSLPTTTNDLMIDADDKFGLLKPSANWQPVFGNSSQLPGAHIAFFENGKAPGPTAMDASPFYGLKAFHTLETTSLPLVVSAGPDGFTGLLEPSDVNGFGCLGEIDATSVNNIYDNITNLNIRSGGK